MLTAILVASLLGQCPGGSCSVSQPAYVFPQYYYAPLGQTPKSSDPAPKVPASASTTQPQLWQLKDRANRTWTHTDPRWLQTYVGRVNAALAPRYYAPVLQYGSPCANGACPR